MVDIQFTIILHRILRVKCDLNLNRKSHFWFNKETDRHLGEIRKKGRKENRLFAATAHMACQVFRERSLWMRPSNRAWFDMADTRSLFRRHFCDNHVCVMVKITTKKAWNGTGELLHERIFRHGASFTRAESRHP